MSRVLLGALFVWVASVLSASAQGGPASCSVTGQNQYVRDVLRDVYLWNEFLPAANPVSFTSPQAYLEAVRYRPRDAHFSFIASAAESQAFYSDSQFIGFGFSTSLLNDELRVLQVYPESPAAEAGLARGDTVLEIDGRSIEALIASGEIGAPFGPGEVGVSVSIVFRSGVGVERQAVMTKRVVTIPTVSLTRAYDLDGRRVGYIFFRNFVQPSVAALDEAFAALHEAKVSELVLDLRYNGGGLVSVAAHLSSLIGGAVTAGQPFATYAHNARNAFRNETLRFEPAPGPAPVLSRLVVITSRGSASASELVINSLRPFMQVVQIGDATYGKPVGQYLFEFCEKVLAPVAFALHNANGEGDYFEGLPPTCVAGDGIDRQLGDPEEASLAEAFHYLRHGVCRNTPEPPASMARRERLTLRATGWQSLLNAH